MTTTIIFTMLTNANGAKAGHWLDIPAEMV
jgi:hypothetical protein